MHSDYRYSHSRLARTSAVRTAAKFPFYRRLLLANNKDTSPTVSMGRLTVEFYCVNQVYKLHSYEGHEKSIVYLRVLKVRNPTN